MTARRARVLAVASFVVMASCVQRQVVAPETDPRSCSASRAPAVASFVLAGAGFGGTAALWPTIVDADESSMSGNCAGCGYVLIVSLLPAALGVGLVVGGARSLAKAGRCRDARRRAAAEHAAEQTMPIFGSVTGLAGTLIVAEGDQERTVTMNGSFRFPTERLGGARYAVSVRVQPEGQTCTVSGGKGVVGAVNVVAIACVSAGAN